MWYTSTVLGTRGNKELYDVAIIGGGVVGCCIARELSRYLVKTVLVEREAEVGFGVTKSNSGIIHAGHHTDSTTLKGRLVGRGNELFDQLHQDLGFGFKRIGELVVAGDEGDMPVLEKLKAQGEAKGVPGLEIWNHETLRREEPNLSKHLIAALHAPSAGVVNPYEFAFALIECAQKNGVHLIVNAPVTSIDVKRAHMILQTPRQAVAARYVLNCTGLFADKVAELVGARTFRILPRKGEEYLLDSSQQWLVKHLIFPVPSKTTKGTLIIPTVDGTIMVGPTAHDTNDRFDLTTTVGGANEVFGFVRQLCPGIDPRALIAEFAGLRPVSNTNDFIIGPTAVRGFINVAGIQSPGLTASPAIAEYVLELLGAEGLPIVEKDEFIPYIDPLPHFVRRTTAERRELTARDPRFGHIVCRCESVTEAEIHRAVDHGAQTIDGVKFRTRAGMGRCQGGFCTTGVMKVLSERLGVPLHNITKRGGNSWLVFPMEDIDKETSESEEGEPCSDA
ncbi:MAG: NAD(P)/FAD-dependent oxidoreductase [Proteobacteria bacterium]|nr:NAD(P)/FAD-dependent oxidoreductase [Pseudomonadota bacterium]